MTKSLKKTENCRWCGKPTNKKFVIADDLENPKPYHKECVQLMILEAIGGESEFWKEKNND